MGLGSATQPPLRFGIFELDFNSGELRKSGEPVRLQPQPFKILALLAARPGELVTRQEIQQKIWGTETFVDFERGLNFCIKQIRAALEDDADTPQYIETLPKRGYRFMAAGEESNRRGEISFEPSLSPSNLQLETTAIPAAPRSKSPLISPEVAEPIATLRAAEGAGAAMRGKRRLRRWIVVGAGAAALLAVGVVISLKLLRRPSLAFHHRDWVLITRFENRTGERVFDGTLEYSLERELSNSTFVNVVPRVRINDTLQLMGRPPNSPINAALGRELSLRDGGIRALLTGRVEKLDTTYLLSASVVNPINGVTIASFSEEAVGQHEVPSTLRHLSNEVRQRLGEQLPLIAQSNQALEKVTTPSLSALRFYSRGMSLVNEYQWESAAAQLEEAVREDPNFASAHILLAHCYTNLGKYSAAAPHYQKAFALVDSTTDRERYFILGG
jgi:eukaryotic-like serine/threonine-protein kinase